MILPPAVTVHGLPHALAALAPGRPVTLLSAPNAAVYAGVGWWRAVVAAAGSPPDILDCGAAAGRVLEARCAIWRPGSRRMIKGSFAARWIVVVSRGVAACGRHTGI
jgi:hypothetical protein